MKRYVKTFDAFYEELNSNYNEKVEELKVSFKDFLKFSQNEKYDTSLNGDVTLQFKDNIELENLDFSSIKQVSILKENWDSISNTQLNYLRKNGIYSFEEFLDYAKEKFKNKVSTE